MARRRDEDLVPLLRLIAEALDARDKTIGRGVGSGLREFGRLARFEVLSGGLLPRSDDRLFDAIERIAVQHFDLVAARSGVEASIGAVEQIQGREELEAAVDRLCSALNSAYFHAGLAFGLTFSELRSL